MPKKLYGVWPKGRNTPIVVRAGSSGEARKVAKKKPAAGAKGPIARSKALNERDARDARAGRWVRTRPDGSRDTSKGSYAFRPQLKKVAKGKKF